MFRTTWAPRAYNTCPTTATERPAEKGPSAARFSPPVPRSRPANLAASPMRAARGLARINAFGEEMPNIENRIELASDKDEFGMPLARIIHSYDQDAAALWNANFEEGLVVAKAAGAKEMWSSRGNMPTIHLLGGTIMGTDASNSITNSYGQTHELPNLYVAGPGIFPTEGASNPTYTIFALSLRGAEQMAANWSAVAS